MRAMDAFEGNSPRRCDRGRCGQVHVLVAAAAVNLMFKLTVCHIESLRDTCSVSSSLEGVTTLASTLDY